MFDIGFLELIIVAIIALLVLGPERLPVAARSVGRWVGKARRMVNKFSQEIDRQVEIDELREQLKKQGESLNINDDAKQIHRTVSEALTEASTTENTSKTDLKDSMNVETELAKSTTQKQ
jgi:sec-independent protein translocase protein TatB